MIKTKKDSLWPKIKELQKQGLSKLQIALKLKCSPQAVYDHLQRRGLKTNEKE